MLGANFDADGTLIHQEITLVNICRLILNDV